MYIDDINGSLREGGGGHGNTCSSTLKAGGEKKNGAGGRKIAGLIGGTAELWFLERGESARKLLSLLAVVMAKGGRGTYAQKGREAFQKGGPSRF